MSLSDDLIREVLGRVDGLTLANGGSVCSHFWSVAKQDIMWEKPCSSIWPSTAEKDVKELITSSLGGFRKFYANCFPSIAYDMEKLNDGEVDLHAGVPSDFVAVVDVRFKNKVVYSKVVWGIPAADGCEGSFFNSPFRVDLVHFSELDYDNQTLIEELPTVFSVEKQSKDDEFWRELVENISLSWIVINRRTGQAANFSSWRPLAGRKHWPLFREYAIRFGSILPAHDILACKAVECVIEIKCTAFDGSTMKITELSMQLEDMMGLHLKGSNALLVLQNALACCKRSTKHIQILRSHGKYLTEQRKLKEAKMKNGGLLDAVGSISGVVALVSAFYFILKEYGPTFSTV